MMKDKMPSVTKRLADFVSQADCQNIPDEVIVRAKYLMLDTIGIMVRASHDSESTQSMMSGVGMMGLDKGRCGVFGDGGGYPPGTAALVNASLAHSLDFDDTHAEASIHASAPIVPAAIAAAQMVGASGKDLLAACVAAYEVHVRLGKAVGAADHYQRGFHPTATCGVFAAAAAVGRVLNLSSAEIESAFGIALSQSAGAMQFLNDGAWTKRLHVGQAAQNGLMAAFFAKNGYKGPQEALEGKWGFFHNYSSDADHEVAVAGLGEDWETMTLGVKPYPSCRYSHAAIDGILDIVDKNGLQGSDNVRIEVGLPVRGYGIIGDPLDQKQSPQSIVDAQFSMPFSAAAAFRKGGLAWDDYRECLNDAKTLELCRNVHVYVDEDAEACSPDNMSAKVKISVGEAQFETFVKVPKGEPEHFMTEQEFRDKFDSLCCPYLDAEALCNLSESVLSLDAHDDAGAALFQHQTMIEGGKLRSGSF